MTAPTRDQITKNMPEGPTRNAITALADRFDELAAQISTLGCVQCAAEQYQAASTGVPEADWPPIRVADVIANGASVCFGHIQFGPAPVAPGRTASGLVLPGQGG